MFQSKSLSSFINKTITTSLKFNNNQNKLFTTIPYKSQSIYILNNNNNQNNNNYNNQISNKIKSILNSNNNNNNNNSSSSFNFNNHNNYRSYSTNNNSSSGSSNNKNQNQNQNGPHLIFENNRPYIHKIMFIVSGVQLCLCIFVLSEYYLESEENRNKLVIAGAIGLTILTHVFFYQMGKKDIASIHTFNKGRVVQITSYSINGFPNRKRTITLDSIISSKANDKIKQPVVNQEQTFYFKVPGDKTYYNASLKGSKILDPFQLDRIIHASKQPTTVTQKKKK